jgi:hypothetical protein
LTIIGFSTDCSIWENSSVSATQIISLAIKVSYSVSTSSARVEEKERVERREIKTKTHAMYLQFIEKNIKK